MTNALRIQQRTEIGALLSQHFASNSAKHWVEAIHAVKVPVGLINNLEQAFEEPQVKARNMLVEMQHPLKEKLQVIGSPIKLSRTPVEYKKAPPMLGEHTDESLSRVVNADQLVELKQKGIIA